MSGIWGSLYGRIALIFLALIGGLAVVQGITTYRLSMEVVRESDQQLNRGLAADLADGFAPYLADSLDIGGIAHEIHNLMVINPHVEIYLLDEEGAPIAYFPEYKVLERETINLATVREFIREGEALPLPFLGDDPRRVDGSKPFSAARLDWGEDGHGYLYVILGGDQYDSAREMISGSAILRTALLSLGGSFVVAVALGLLLFSRVTRRLRGLTGLVARYRKSPGTDRSTLRARVTSDDEIDQLGSAFNEMADEIDSAVARLEETDRTRRELIANVSHDLQSPLASVRGYLERLLIEYDRLDDGDRREHVATALASADRLCTLVDELFELSKLDAKQVVPQPEPFSIAELVQDVAVALRPKADAAGISMRTEVGAGMPVVKADIGLIERVVSNLIENAIRYTDSGGSIDISIAREGQQVVVNVSDTGCGIPPEDVPHIFDRFYRVDKSRSMASGGAGLGLAIAKKILDAHDAVITCQSKLDVGTTFAFGLPAHSPSTSPIG